MIVDLADLQWWQTLVALLGVLGLSPAPWILGLAVGRLQFTKPADMNYDQRVKDLKEQHATSTAAVIKAHEVVIEALAKSHVDTLAGHNERIADLKATLARLEDARNVERDRADAATQSLARVVDVVETNNHFLESLGTATQKGS